MAGRHNGCDRKKRTERVDNSIYLYSLYLCVDRQQSKARPVQKPCTLQITMTTTEAAVATGPECRMYDDFSLQSMQPSDEMGGGLPVEERDGGDEVREGVDDTLPTNPVHQDEDPAQDDNRSHASGTQHSFVKYLTSGMSKLKSLGRTTLGETIGDEIHADRENITTRADTKTYTSTVYNQSTAFVERSTHSQGGMERSTHSRCVIENTEKVAERQNSRREQQRHQADGDAEAFDDCNGTRDHGYSVEEFTQISELTMDIHTVMAEPKFPSCAALPTITEARKFNPALAGCSPGLAKVTRKNNNSDTTSSNLRSQCGLGGSPRGRKGDVIDFVFELVEDALCVPINGSKSDKNKAFANAVHEESVKLARTNSLVDQFQTTGSKHSRSQRTTKRSNFATTTDQTATNTNVAVDSCQPMKDTARSSRTPNSMLASEHIRDEMGNHTDTPDRRESTFVIVDKAPSAIERSDAPTHAPTPKPTATFNEEQTLDWSKIMSFAEKQLEVDENKSVLSKAESKFSRVSRMTRQSRKSFFTAMGDDEMDLSKTGTDNKVPVAPSSSRSTSSSTHATAAVAANEANENSRSSRVDGLRDVSAMDSSTYDEDEHDDENGVSRLLLTSLLLKLLRQCISFVKATASKSIARRNRTTILAERQITAQARIAQFGEESAIFRCFRYVIFFLCFVLWPSGIPRRKVEYPPIPTKAEKPSLLKLVTTGEPSASIASPSMSNTKCEQSST